MSSVGHMLNQITSLEELQGFADMLFHPPPGVEVKPHTEADRQRIATMKIEFQKRAGK